MQTYHISRTWLPATFRGFFWDSEEAQWGVCVAWTHPWSVSICVVNVYVCNPEHCASVGCIIELCCLGSTYVCVYVCVYIYMYMHACMCMYIIVDNMQPLEIFFDLPIALCVCVCVCIYIYICIHTHTNMSNSVYARSHRACMYVWCTAHMRADKWHTCVCVGMRMSESCKNTCACVCARMYALKQKYA